MSESLRKLVLSKHWTVVFQTCSKSTPNDTNKRGKITMCVFRREGNPSFHEKKNLPESKLPSTSLFSFTTLTHITKNWILNASAIWKMKPKQEPASQLFVCDLGACYECQQ